MSHKKVGGSKGKAMPKKHGAGGSPRSRGLKHSNKNTAYEGQRKKVFGLSGREDKGCI